LRFVPQSKPHCEIWTQAPITIKERFIDAARRGIAALHSKERELNEMPKELREEFLAFIDKLTSARPSGQGSIYNTVISISEDDIRMLVDVF
jgi:hypothetical protein